ncbi:MarR family winged helix-turn-helix transcriptional regulator [Oryzibacter oryziterrae]|uniref:MarR family winged helix-turn-helix transcriptional regulator n=1 Tax=Oryzibacter oryziterrae TaxID=2766474 RepID=UPI001F168B12|nr:MarR family transcriptional regulator [Oryzibacter oryziterrae]
MDHVDRILEQWHRERPDLDVGPMGLFGRLSRLMVHLRGEIEANLARHQLSPSSFDVMATLRRSGSPFRLPIGDILGTLMITSGTLTNRVDQLEKQGFVVREINERDGRSILVRLTDAGLARVDEAVTTHVATQHKLLDNLAPEDREALGSLLRRYLQVFEGVGEK